MPDEEFNVLGEKDLVLLSRRFERMYMNRKNAQRSSGMCYRCKKHKHFITEWSKVMEIKPSTSTIKGMTISIARGTTKRARTSPSRGRGRVAVTRRRSVRWLPEHMTSTQVPTTLHRARASGQAVKQQHQRPVFRRPRLLRHGTQLRE
jgi:hypothetical protein